MGIFNLRLQDNIHDKLKIIAEKQNRSQNKQAEFIIKQFIADYEKVNGKVETDTISK